MSRVRDQGGFTLIELLVAMGISLVVMGSVVTILTVFLNDTHYDGLRDQAQTDSKVVVDQLSRDLRSAASPSSGTTGAGLLQKANAFDILFQTVNPNKPVGGTPSGNAANQEWVRYCLDSSDTLWRQTDLSISTTPDTSNCPSTSNDWSRKSNGNPCCVRLTDVTNEIGGDTTRPLFTFGPSTATNTEGTTDATKWVTDPTLVREVQLNVITDLNPGHLPGPSPQLTSGIYLRNENSSPVNTNFNVTSNGTGGSTRQVTLDGTQAYDPNGQTLQYQWYATESDSAGSCTATTTPTTGLLSDGTSQTFSDTAANTAANDTTFTSGSTWTFALVVTDTQGLSTCHSETVTIS